MVTVLSFFFFKALILCCPKRNNILEKSETHCPDWQKHEPLPLVRCRISHLQRSGPGVWHCLSQRSCQSLQDWRERSRQNKEKNLTGIPDTALVKPLENRTQLKHKGISYWSSRDPKEELRAEFIYKFCLRKGGNSKMNLKWNHFIWRNIFTDFWVTVSLLYPTF